MSSFEFCLLLIFSVFTSRNATPVPRSNSITGPNEQPQEANNIPHNKDIAHFDSCLNWTLKTEIGAEAGESSIFEADPWEPPLHIQKDFPVYISGFDDENRPIIVVEYGKWNVRKVIEKGGQDQTDFEKYLEQGLYRFSLGADAFKDLTGNTSFADSSSPGSVLLLDLQGFNLVQMAHIPTIRFLLNFARKLQKIQDSVAYGFFINVNYLAETLINLTRPVLGSTFERIEVYGTNPGIWKPKLLRKLPRSQLPPAYGGSKDFKPFFTYG